MKNKKKITFYFGTNANLLLQPVWIVLSNSLDLIKKISLLGIHLKKSLSILGIYLRKKNQSTLESKLAPLHQLIFIVRSSSLDVINSLIKFLLVSNS